MHHVAADVFRPLEPRARFDLVLSNPPYVRRDELARLQPEIRDWEDRDGTRARCGQGHGARCRSARARPAALDGGPDGADVIRTLVRRLGDWLAPGARAWLEVAPEHPALVADLCVATGGAVRFVQAHADMAGRPRYCELRAASA